MSSYFRQKKVKVILTIAIALLIILIIANPSYYTGVSFNAITVWAKVLLPSLLPFFIFTRLMTSLGIVKDISNTFGKIPAKLYKLPKVSFYVFFLSIITGYPIGSKLVSDLYHSGEITRVQAQKITTFTSNSGPMFIVGSVGAGLFLSAKIGYIILISHILGAVLNGLLYRNLKDDNVYFKNKKAIDSSEGNILSDSVSNSISSILLVGGIIVLSFIIIEVLIKFNVFYPITFLFNKIGIETGVTTSILSGLLEITKGCQLISALNIGAMAKASIACFIISFGGFSTILQSMAFLKDITNYKFFTLQKTTHAIISTIICVCLCAILL